MIQKIDVVSRGKVRRSRLYYLRDLSGKAARIKERAYEAFKDIVVEEEKEEEPEVKEDETASTDQTSST